ncbi:MAG: ERCC4 domain-containing protein [Thermoplasmatota archaeon]
MSDAEGVGPAPLYMDVREPKDIADHVRAKGVPVEIRALQPADYVAGACAVERKTVNDFASSIYDGRLFEQIERMVTTYDEVAIVLEGDPRDILTTPNPGAIYGALASVAVEWGVAVVPTSDMETTGLFLAMLYRRQGREGGPIAVRHKVPRPTPEREALFIVQGLPGVGDVMSARLRERFGSARRALAATESELRRVPGLGPQRARRIAEVLDRPWKNPHRAFDSGLA